MMKALHRNFPRSQSAQRRKLVKAYLGCAIDRVTCLIMPTVGAYLAAPPVTQIKHPDVKAGVSFFLGVGIEICALRARYCRPG
jgi:hypothetical protein